jgi:hypothetical protein
MIRRAFIKRASGLLVPLAFPAIVRGQGIPEPILSLMNAPSPTAAAAQLVLVTAQTLGTLRNNATLPAGLTFLWGGVSATCTALGRWKVSGNSATHVVELMSASCVQQAAVTVDNSTGSAGAYNYVDLITPFTLVNNTTYFLFSLELNGGDQWYDSDTTVTKTSDSASISNANSDGISCFTGTANTASVPVNLKYHF